MSTTNPVKLPPVGWRIEQLGIIGAISFTCPGCTLMWCDGEWTIGAGGVFRGASALPRAASMQEARAVGCNWLSSLTELDQLPGSAEREARS